MQVPVANVKTTNKLGETRPNLYDKGAIIKVGGSFCAWEYASRMRECFVRPWGHKACQECFTNVSLHGPNMYKDDEKH